MSTTATKPKFAQEFCSPRPERQKHSRGMGRRRSSFFNATSMGIGERCFAKRTAC